MHEMEKAINAKANPHQKGTVYKINKPQTNPYPGRKKTPTSLKKDKNIS